RLHHARHLQIPGPEIGRRGARDRKGHGTLLRDRRPAGSGGQGGGDDTTRQGSFQEGSSPGKRRSIEESSRNSQTRALCAGRKQRSFRTESARAPRRASGPSSPASSPRG